MKKNRDLENTKRSKKQRVDPKEQNWKIEEEESTEADGEELEYYKLEFYVNSMCLSAQELKYLRLEFYHETWVLKTWDAIFPHYFTNITTNEIVKNLRPNGEKKKKKKNLQIVYLYSTKKQKHVLWIQGKEKKNFHMHVHGKTYIWLMLKLNAIENTKTL